MRVEGKRTIGEVGADSEAGSDPGFVRCLLELDTPVDVQRIGEHDDLWGLGVETTVRLNRSLRVDKQDLQAPRRTRLRVGADFFKRLLCHRDELDRVAGILPQTFPPPRAFRVRNKVVKERAGRERVGQGDAERPVGVDLPQPDGMKVRSLGRERRSKQMWSGPSPFPTSPWSGHCFLRSLREPQCP